MMDSNTHYSTVGATACAADTETELGGADIVLPGDGPVTITELYLQGLNEVDAKASSMKVELKISGVPGPFKVAMFQGQGASASQGAHLEDRWKCNIKVPSAARIGIYVTAVEAWSFVIGGIKWKYGHSGNQTYSDLVGPTDSNAARTLLGGAAMTLNPGVFTITELRTSIQGVEDDKFAGGKVELIVPGVSDETFPGGCGGTAATNGSTSRASSWDISIRVSGNSQVSIYFTSTETTVDNIASITYQ